MLVISLHSTRKMNECLFTNGRAGLTTSTADGNQTRACALTASECPIQDGEVGGEGEAEAGPNRIEQSLLRTPIKPLQGKGFSH